MDLYSMTMTITITMTSTNSFCLLTFEFLIFIPSEKAQWAFETAFRIPHFLRSTSTV